MGRGRAGGQAAAAPRRARRKVWAAEAERARSGRAAGAAREGPRGGGRGAEAGREGRGREGAATGWGRRCPRPLPPPPARRPGSRSSGARGGRGPVPREGGPQRPQRPQRPRAAAAVSGREGGVAGWAWEGAVPKFRPGGAAEESKVRTENPQSQSTHSGSVCITGPCRGITLGLSSWCSLPRSALATVS
ncbi:translation initiation factor IF-2-like isoform X2 [Cervus elaphus]|uniref:translation initiation factor IF-2-like isoform X2 n=1 Tax=Cervus canadensis TaxID=1574408 RepID=UPI001CA30216|nr:translation initiation factor IF-2-like isoform X2 [Cervus canadensis]XP_043765573.1 translation initiation factor IF-2-like isoform X2 [Cervus elaphus]